MVRMAELLLGSDDSPVFSTFNQKQALQSTFTAQIRHNGYRRFHVGKAFTKPPYVRRRTDHHPGDAHNFFYAQKFQAVIRLPIA
jgi:hypothetical protein